MTEDEAKTKWCPFIRSVAATKYAKTHTNRMAIIDDYTSDKAAVQTTVCLGSDCMAWNWLPPDIFKSHVENKTPTDGYCSLTGRCF